MEILGDEGSARLLPLEVRGRIVGRRQPAEIRRFGKGDWSRHVVILIFLFLKSSSGMYSPWALLGGGGEKS